MIRPKIIIVALMAIALATFAVDCGATMSAQQAALCCKHMDCPSQGHDSQGCCKIAGSLHSPFIQTALHSGSSPSVALAIVSATYDAGQKPGFDVVLVQSHAPPLLQLPPNLPIRI